MEANRIAVTEPSPSSRSGASTGGSRWSWRPRTNPIWYFILALMFVINIAPLLWLLLTSFKAESQVIAYPPTITPAPATLGDYFRLFQQTEFGVYLEHSALVAAVTTFTVVILGTVGAYALARFPFRFVRWLGEVSLLAYMIPSILLLVPLVQIMYMFHLDNNLLSVMLIYSASLLPFALWTLRSYFYGVAAEIEQQAMVDGCTRFQAFIRVVLPQATAGIIATAVFAFNAAWGEYMFASTLLTSPDATTLSPGLIQLEPAHGIPEWGMLSAACVIMVFPLIALFTIFQRQLVETWGEGAVRG